MSRPLKRLFAVVTMVLALTGAVVGQILARHQVLFVKIMAPFWGAIAGLAVVSVGSAFIRVFLGIARLGSPPEPPKLDFEWRTKAQRNMERMRRNGEFMARQAWIIALISTDVAAAMVALVRE